MSIPLLLVLLFGCSEPAPQSPATTLTMPKTAPAAPAAKPKTDAEKTVLDVAVGSPDHTTLVAAVKAAGKAPALGSPGGIYTVFAPTNAAFDALPAGTVDTLLKPENKTQLLAVVQHHAMVPILETKDMKDGQVLKMADGTPVTLHVGADGVVTVDEARILASVSAVNGVVHVVDKVLVPPSK